MCTKWRIFGGIWTFFLISFNWSTYYTLFYLSLSNGKGLSTLLVYLICNDWREKTAEWMCHNLLQMMLSIHTLLHKKHYGNSSKLPVWLINWSGHLGIYYYIYPSNNSFSQELLKNISWHIFSLQYFLLLSNINLESLL